MSLCSEYQIGRRKYPIVNMSESNSKELERRKKSAGVGLLFLVIGVIGIICTPWRSPDV